MTNWPFIIQVHLNLFCPFKMSYKPNLWDSRGHEAFQVLIHPFNAYQLSPVCPASCWATGDTELNELDTVTDLMGLIVLGKFSQPWHY